jgi:anti-sigma-K factor RskA
MNTTNSTAKEREPSEIEMLLPWYAAGTLDAAEAQQVEAALAADPELARRYEWVRAEFAEETSISEAAGEPSADDVKALFAKIDALPAARRPVASSGLAERIAEFLASFSPRTLAWSAMAAALAIVLQAGLIAGIAYKESTGGYQTASVPNNTVSDGTFVLMRFKPESSAADITTFMDTNKLSIVGGPFGGGLYRVRVASTKLSKDDLARIVTTLQGDKVIGFIAATD